MATKSEPDVDLERALGAWDRAMERTGDGKKTIREIVSEEFAAEFRAVRLEEAKWWGEGHNSQSHLRNPDCSKCKRIAELEAK